MNVKPWIMGVKLLAVLGFAVCLWILPLHASAAPALQVAPPPNDNFADAAVIGSLPFEATVDNAGATAESAEPFPNCVYTTSYQTAWYAFTPQSDTSVSLNLSTAMGSGVLAIYTGSSLTSQQPVDCHNVWWSPFALRLSAGTTYYIQVLTPYNSDSLFTLNVQFTPPPVLNGFGISPPYPSTATQISFSPFGWDPAGIGYEKHTWDFGDGSPATTLYWWEVAYHTYAKEGVYTAKVTGTTFDGRSASASGTVSVANHDVVITKFTVPQSARSGQTRQISVGINSRLHDERVTVTLFKSVPGVGDGFQFVGSLIQTVPVRSANRTTSFDFSYTFSAADAQQSLVTFKAVADISVVSSDNYYYQLPDLAPADNTAISLPTKVNGAQATAVAGDAAPVSNGEIYLPVVRSE